MSREVTPCRPPHPERRAWTVKRLNDYTLAELQAQGIYPAAVMEAHSRVAGAVACVAFVLVGIRLGIRTSRRETTIGIAISLGLAFAYYFVVIFAHTLKDKPHLYPEAILWAPCVAFQVVGLWLLWRLSRS